MAYSYGFRGKTIFYNTALEFGYKCAKEAVLSEMGGNPYDPDNTDYDDFISGVLKFRKEQKTIYLKSRGFKLCLCVKRERSWSPLALTS